MDKNKDLIHVLNNLIETCHDGENGLREAAQHVTAPHVQTFLSEASSARARFATDLAPHVRTLGGEPTQSGRGSGAVRQAWMNIKSAIGGGDHTILASAEKGEDCALHEYEQALKSKALSPMVSAAVAHQLAEIRKVHDRVKTLRDVKI